MNKINDIIDKFMNECINSYTTMCIHCGYWSDRVVQTPKEEDTLLQIIL